jgi:NAD(P)-dependent dehydrogenase (short-subunit alcohol dehydrogenase family)
MAFHGKVALVTGAASGMGRLAVQRLAATGASVAALDVDEEGLRQTASGFQTIRNWAVDVSNAQAVDAAVGEAERELGPIDRVVHAAAIMPTALLLEQDRDTIHRIMEVNYGGTVNLTRATLPGMVERGAGDFVLFASLAGWVPAPHFGAYNASKFAVVAFADVLRQECRRTGVRFACVCPPPVETPLLAQATSNPKFLQRMRPLPPSQVLDALETALERGRFWVFPGRGTALAWRLRRLLPGPLWRRFLRVEGL